MADLEDNNPMLKIDIAIFNKNLHLTQAYCHIQSFRKEKSIAATFRSYNPVVSVRSPVRKKSVATFFRHLFTQSTKKALFTFEKGHLIPDTAYCSIWALDPFKENTIHNLFEEQLAFKFGTAKSVSTDIYEGAILVCHIDQTPVDGASERESLGFMDMYDLPPIDTWFYLTEYKNEKLLFAWIPKDFMQLANDGILVNCIECFTWFEDTYPETFDSLKVCHI